MKKRKNIYIGSATEALLATIADRYHDGKESAAIAAALSTYIERPALICQAVLDLAASVEPDERYDPEDDPRAVGPTLRLSALLDAQSAAGIGDALAVLWNTWRLEQRNGRVPATYLPAASPIPDDCPF